MLKLLYIFIQFCVFVLVLSSAGDVLSQGIISGKVVDLKTGEALAFANIRNDIDYSVADANGYFSIDCPEKNVIITITYIGYVSYELDTVIVNSSLDLGIIKLTEDIKTISEVTITSGKFRKSIEDVTVSMESLKPEFLEKNNTVRFDNILEKIPGVSFVDGQANIRGGSGFTYGAGSRVLILYDNIPALQFDSAFPNWSNIPVENIAKVEVMKGAGSALYGSSAMNGVINILSRTAKREPYLKVKTFFTVYDSPADTAKRWWYEGANPFKYGISGEFAQKIGKLDLVSSLYFMHDPENFKKDCKSYIGRGTFKLDYHFTDAFSAGLHPKSEHRKQDNVLLLEKFHLRGLYRR